MKTGSVPLETTRTYDFVTAHPTTGAAATATSVTVEVFEDANDTPILSPTATERTSRTGDYRVQVAATSANGFELGKSYNVVVTAVVAGVTARGVVASFIVGPPLVKGAVVSDAFNTASAFKTDLTQADDTWKDSLLVFVTGSLAGQVKKVSDFDNASGVITTGAFTAAPSAGDIFLLVNV